MKNLECFTLNHRHFIKRTITNILCSEPFCGLCYETGKRFNALSEQLKIVTAHWTQDVWLKDVLSYVFNEMENLSASQYICSECTEQLGQSYIFIKNAKVTTELLSAYISDLESKSKDLLAHLKENNVFETTNIVIMLENNDINKCLPKDSNETERRAGKVEDNISPGIKLKTDPEVSFECPEIGMESQQRTTEDHKGFKCNICLKSFEKQQYLAGHYRIHSKVMCRVCQLIISDEDIKDHLRSIHPYALHEKLLNAINKEVPKCEICLLDLGDNGTHDCELKCLECNEAPCIHNKYLISYREQVHKNASKLKCLDCNFVCRKKEILIGHVNKEHLNYRPYTCDKCGLQFYAKAVLKAHIQFYHREINTCKYCDLDCNNSMALTMHEVDCRKTKQRSVCPICPASFATDKALAKHKKQKHKEVLPCEKKEESYKKELTFKVDSEVQFTNKSTLECVICEKMFDTKGELTSHRKKHGPNVKYPCRICHTEYDTLRQLRIHGRKHVGPFATCDICGKEMRKFLIETHIKNHAFDGIMTCKTCGKSFQTHATLKYHEKLHQNEVQCAICDQMINPARMRRHVIEHKVQENPSLKENQKQKANAKCEFCEYVTWNKVLLECHTNRHHHRTKPYICHICSKDFFGINLLKKHIKSHRKNTSNKERAVCMVCGKTFANAASLRLHLRLHTGEKNYACDICGEKFRSASIKNVHKLKRHAGRGNGCPLCPSKFYTKGELRRHVIKVHWKDERKRFDPRQLKGMENHYHLFHDGRRVKMGDDVEMYMPCITYDNDSDNDNESDFDSN